MNQNLVAKLFRDQRWTIPSYAIGVLGYCLAIIGVYPTVRQNTQMFDDYVKQFPEAFTKAFGIEGSMSSFNGFISMEFLSLMMVIIGAAFAIAYGGAMVAKEVETGTIELLLSAPVSRWRIIASKIGVMVAGLVVIVASTIAAIWVGALLVDAQIDVMRYVVVGILAFAFFLAIGSYATLFSSFSSERGRPTVLSIVVTLVFYLVNFLANYLSNMQDLKYFSLFYYYQPRQILDTGAMPWGDLAVFVAMSAFCLAAASVIFHRRDITV